MRNKRLQIRLSEKEFEQLRDYAVAAKSSISDVLRELIRNLRVPTKDL
jgi:hypothetical protein